MNRRTVVDLYALMYMIQDMGTRHNCGKAINGRYWMLCTACQGRLHLPGCTTKRDPKKDCCEARHKALYEKGQTLGIADSSVPMYDAKNRSWDNG